MDNPISQRVRSGPPVSTRKGAAVRPIARAVSRPRFASLGDAMLDAPRYRSSQDELVLRQRRLALYCNAVEVPDALEYLARFSANVTALVLHDSDGVQPELPSNARLVAPSELLDHPELVPVAFGQHLDRKVVRLALHGVRHLVFAVDPGFNPTVRFDPEFYRQHQKELEWLYGQLVDEESRMVLAGIVRMRVTGDYGYIRLSNYPEYDHPIVRPQPGETVFDLGMETAHTSLWFGERVGPEGRVFGFEASPEHWEQIEAALRAADARNVEMVRKGVWNSVSELSFLGGMAGASRVTYSKNPQATLKVPVIPIDNFVRERRIAQVSLLSFDVEGSEPEALEGAAETIRRDHPKLQVSIYHRMPHLYELPRLVASFGRPYRFYLGHHSAQGLETDLYALPA